MIEMKELCEIANGKLVEIMDTFSKKDLSECGFMAFTERNFKLEGRQYKLKRSCINPSKDRRLD